MLLIFILLFLFLTIVSLIITSLGFSFGVRKWYVFILLRIFEFGRQKIEKAELRLNRDGDVNDCIENEINHKNELKIDNNDRRKQNINSELQIIDQKEFHLSDITNLIHMCIEAIVDDEVTKRFDAEELPSWNLLTRTNKNYQYISLRLTILWGIGFIFRYFILMPTRVFITIVGVLWLIICTALVGCFSDGPFKRWLYWNVSLMCFRVLSRAYSAIVTYHDRHNMAKGGGITVANHTNPLDVAILACDNCYALVGQRQGGFLGIIQRALERATYHIWFERFEITDRELVTRRLRQHVEDPNKLPILIFPEGTCINNSAVMMFKKGSFEVGGTIYPISIKYDPRFGDPFWNSTKHGYMYYLLMMMTSWAIVCDVWYLPPMTRKENENAIEFANRVKAEIAKRGGLVDLQWDGQLKRMKVKTEWKQQQQQEFSKRIKLD